MKVIPALAPLAAALVVLHFLVPTCRAQGERRQRTAPSIVMSTSGRNGRCDVLRFTPDGRHLLAAGDDKVLRVWPIRNGRIDQAGQRLLRWEIFGVQRGSIYAAALIPDTRRVAVG